MNEVYQKSPCTVLHFNNSRSVNFTNSEHLALIHEVRRVKWNVGPQRHESFDLRLTCVRTTDYVELKSKPNHHAA